MVDRVGVHRVGVDDSAANVAEGRVHGVCQGVHCGRLMVAGDDDARALMFLQITGEGAYKLCRVARVHRSATIHTDTGRQRSCEVFDLHCAQRQPVIGFRSGRGWIALDHIQPAHFRVGIALLREIADVAHIPRKARVEKVGVKGNNHSRVLDPVLCLQRFAKCQLSAFKNIVSVRRFVNMPLRLGIHRQEGAHLVFQCGRRHGLRENANARAT